MKGRGAWGSPGDQYQERRDYDSNPPAPHGKPFGLFDAINTIRDLRSPQNGASRGGLGGSAVGVPAGRGLDRFAAGREETANIGPFTPIAKLLKKVCKLEPTPLAVDCNLLTSHIGSLISGDCEYAVRG